MSDKEIIEISIPADNDGFVLLQCSYCGEFFRLSALDCEDENILNVYCPSCGLISDNYMTEDVKELAVAIAENYALDKLYDALKDFERSAKVSGFMQFKTGKKPKHKIESPIRLGIENLEMAYFNCCQRSAKIKPLLRMSGCYCPFCGVKNYEIE